MTNLISKDDVEVENLSLDSQVDSDETFALEDGDQEEIAVEYAPILDHIQHEFKRSKDRRFSDEERWLECYRNFRGIYGPDVQFTDTEKSQAFIKITKTKVLAAYAQIQEVLFSTQKFPIGVEATPVPLGIADAVNIDMKKPPEESAKSSTMRPDIAKLLGATKDRLEPVIDKVDLGVGLTPTSFTWEPAKIAAKEMEKLIHDQLDECDASKELRNFAFELALFGTGVFKGPFAVTKDYPKWDETGAYKPITQTIPQVKAESIWNVYPDADANNMEQSEKITLRHKMSKSQLRALKKRPYFMKDAIEDLITEGPNYVPEYWESTIHDFNNEEDQQQRWEVLEFWGTIDQAMAEDSDFKIPKEYKDRDELQINAWISGGKVIRLVLNPFTPARIPFYAVPYELNPYSFFGVGVAENMTDTQLVMNGFIRLAIDNAALSSNLVFEVDSSALKDGQDMKIYPGKIFERVSGPVGQAIFSHKFQNVTQECLLMFDKARQLSDEATGIPSYSHGMSGVMSTGRTASGMSMLMGAAAQNIKAVVKNIDDYLLSPLGKSLFAFNMQFNFDPKYIGDVDVVAKGTESLMRNEVRSQKLMQFFQIGMNPVTAPFMKVDYILREIAKALDLDSDKVVNDPREAAIQAQILGAMGMAQNPQEAPQGAGGPQVDQPPQPGAAQGPGEQGFSGAPQATGPQPQPQPQQ